MKPKYVSVYPNNNKLALKNKIFTRQKNKGVEFTSYKDLRNYLSKKNILINTYDIKKGANFKNIHFDIPYPLPSNFYIWKIMLTQRKENVLICTEPPIVNPFNYMKVFSIFFTKIYTWNDELVDNKKYFKITLPKSSLRSKMKIKNFKDKKFLILINSNKSSFYPFKFLSSFGKELYSERIKAIEFFEQKIPKQFYLYGGGWNKPKKYNLKELLFGYRKYSTYKGEIEKKLKLLSGFKYCICFENLTNADGYITEKIFDCFKAKCVPIYWGASNIEKYIPKNCFIDFRDFENYEELLAFLNSIDEKKYNRYIENIEKLLKDKKFINYWFNKDFNRFFLEEVLEIKETYN